MTNKAIGLFLGTFILTTLPAPATANTLDQVLQRLDRLENELAQVKKENVSLRDKLRRPEARQETPRISPDARPTGTHALAAAAPVYKAPPVSRFSWAGPFVGIHAGATWGTKEWEQTSFLQSGASGPVLFEDDSGSYTVNGVLGGVQAGINWQSDWMVYGAEAQLSWSNASGHGRCLNLSFAGVELRCTTEARYLGTLAGRFGGSVGGALLYVKGGGAWVRDHYTFTSSVSGAPAIATPESSLKDNRWGWLLGTGIELALSPNWSAKVEYEYLDFGTQQYTFHTAATDTFGAAIDFNVDIRQRMHLIKAGLNYHFDYGKAPLVARY